MWPLPAPWRLVIITPQVHDVLTLEAFSNPSTPVTFPGGASFRRHREGESLWTARNFQSRSGPLYKIHYLPKIYKVPALDRCSLVRRELSKQLISAARPGPAAHSASQA